MLDIWERFDIWQIQHRSLKGLEHVADGELQQLFPHDRREWFAEYSIWNKLQKADADEADRAGEDNAAGENGLHEEDNRVRLPPQEKSTSSILTQLFLYIFYMIIFVNFAVKSIII